MGQVDNYELLLVELLSFEDSRIIRNLRPDSLCYMRSDPQCSYGLIFVGQMNSHF